MTKTKQKTAKSAPKKGAKKLVASRNKTVAAASQKVDYYPNRMTVAISALAGTLLVLFALIGVLGSQ